MSPQAVNIHNLFKGIAKTLVCLWGGDKVYVTCLDLKGLLGDETNKMLNMVYYGS